MTKNPFNLKETIDHLAATKASGILTSTEQPGIENHGSWLSGSDAAKEMAMGILLLNLFLSACHFVSHEIFWLVLLFTLSWSLWKGGRSAWLGWSQLEKLHRLLALEKHSIVHDRIKSREELSVLYSAKGFKDKLLEEVLDVLMANENRLLLIMVEEKLNLTLEKYEHPLKQGLGAFTGSIFSGFLMLAGISILPINSLYITAILIIGLASAIAAKVEGNHPITAVVWNLSLATLVYGCAYFLFQLTLSPGSVT